MNSGLLACRDDIGGFPASCLPASVVLLSHRRVVTRDELSGGQSAVFYTKYHQWLKWQQVANSQPDPGGGGALTFHGGQGMFKIDVQNYGEKEAKKSAWSYLRVNS